MSGFIFLSERCVVEYHDLAVKEYGGLSGVKDQERLEAALALPESTHVYGGVNDIFKLSACYIEAIAKSDAFHDGNELTAFMCGIAFLHLNGYGFTYDDHFVMSVKAIAANTITTEGLAKLLSLHSEPL